MSEPRREGREAQEPLAALERLLRRNIVTQEEAQTAARLITGDPNAVFPPPPPPAAPPPAKVEAPPTEGANGDGGAPATTDHPSK